MKPLDWILQRLFPKTWDRAVHRVATKRGLTDEQVRAKLGNGDWHHISTTAAGRVVSIDGDGVEFERAVVAALEKHVASGGHIKGHLR